MFLVMLLWGRRYWEGAKKGGRFWLGLERRTFFVGAKQKIRFF